MFLWLLLLAAPAYPHGGGVDDNGGHYNHRFGQYHCHRASCVMYGNVNHSTEDQSTNALKEAQKENRPYSKVYSRHDWPHWIDTDRDCQDTRAELLIVTSQRPVRFRNEKQCSVVEGQWYDPYSGKTLKKAGDLDIDHIITVVYNMV
jgi:hypothetical protein